MSIPARVLVLPSPTTTDAVDLGAALAALERAGLQLVDEQEVTVEGLPHALGHACARWGLVLVLGGPAHPEAGALRAVRVALRAEWPGLPAAVQALWRDHAGPLGLLADAAGGAADQALLVALPGPVDLAVAALEQHVLPLLPRLLPADEEPTFTGSRVQLAQVPSARAPAGEAAAAPASWQAALAGAEATLSRGASPPLPDALANLAAVRNVLDQAGERGTVTLPDGRALGAYGYPDLRRASSKVLLVGPGDPIAEVVALHRHPRLAGMSCRDGTRLVPDPGRDLDGVAEERTGAPMPTGTAADRLYAVDGGAIYVERGGRIVSWDGRRERDEGTPRQALASLVLRWSQR